VQHQVLPQFVQQQPGQGIEPRIELANHLEMAAVSEQPPMPPPPSQALPPPLAMGHMEQPSFIQAPIQHQATGPPEASKKRFCSFEVGCRIGYDQIKGQLTFNGRAYSDVVNTNDNYCSSLIN